MTPLSETRLLSRVVVDKLAGHGLREVSQLFAYAATPEGLVGLSRFLGVPAHKLDQLLEQLRAQYPAEWKLFGRAEPPLKPAYGLLVDE